MVLSMIRDLGRTAKYNAALVALLVAIYYLCAGYLMAQTSDDVDLVSPVADSQNNERLRAAMLTSSIEDSIEDDEDVDHFRIVVTPDAPRVMIYATGFLYTTGVLTKETDDGSVDVVAMDDDGGVFGNFQISRTLEAGTYYLTVESRSGTGEYTVHLATSEVITDDHSDERSDATELTSSVAGRIEWGDDIDYFRIVVTPEAPGVTIHTTGALDTRGVLMKETDGGNVEVVAMAGVSGNFQISRTLEAGTYYVSVESYRSNAGAYGVHLMASEVVPDDHSDERSDATELTSSVAGRIEPGDDVDYFRIVVTPEAPLVTIRTTGTLDTYGVLMKETDGGNVEVVAMDDVGGFSGNFQISRTLEAGTYYVSVESYYVTDTGEYMVHLMAPEVVPDDHSDERSDATELTSSVAGRIEWRGDIDYFRIIVTPEAPLVTIRTTGTLDTYGVLMKETDGGNVEVVARDNNGAVSGHFVPGNFQISRTLEAGTYYVSVESHDVTDTGEYMVHLMAPEVVPDDHSDERSDATELTSSVAGRIEWRGDIDYFRIIVTPEAPLVTIHTTGALDTYGELRKETEYGSVELVAADNDGGVSGNFQISRTLEAGTYYLRVATWSETGEYMVHLMAPEVVPDDHSDERSDATELTSSVAGRIEPGDDVDYFRIVVTPEAPLVTIHTTGALDTYGELTKETEYGSVKVVAMDDDGGVSGNFQISGTLEAGTYYVSVESYRWNAGAYGVHLMASEVVPDEHSDERSDATELTSSVAGRIEPRDDVDYFRIVVKPEAPLVTIHTTGDLDTFGVLTRGKGDGNVETIASDNDSGDGHNFSMSRTLEAGTYHVGVVSYEADTGEYTVHVDVVSRSE